MHKLMDYVCDELEELERKVEKGGKLTMAETEYVGELLDTKKNMLKIGEMEDGSSYASRSNRGGSYEGRYSSERGYSRDSDLMEEIEMLPEHKKNEIRRMIKDM